MSELLKGKEVVEELNEELLPRVETLRKAGIRPSLAIIRVGENPSDMSYENMAAKRGEKVGIDVKKYHLEENVEESKLLNLIDEINDDNSIHGLLIFRPLPKHIRDEKVREAIDPAKDIDGITDVSMANVYAGGKYGFPPCTPKACMEILKRNKVELEGKKVVIIGRSLVVGKPLAMMLLAENATVTICHSRTKGIEKLSREADIIVAAIGRAKAIGVDYVSENQTIIDVGINVDGKGNLCGDVDFDNVADKVKAITPVPGGVGTVTTSILIKNVIEVAVRGNE